jgi:hypothetical protein
MGMGWEMGVMVFGLVQIQREESQISYYHHSPDLAWTWSHSGMADRDLGVGMLML